MAFPSYESYNPSGESELQDVLQLLCRDVSDERSPSSTSTSTEDQLELPIMSDEDFSDLTGFSFLPNDIAFDPVLQNFDNDLLYLRHNEEAWDSPEDLDDCTVINSERYKEVQNLGIVLDISKNLARPMRIHTSYPVLQPQLRDELVSLYFDHIHPLCPIIDEQNFWWHFISLSNKEFLETFPAIMFHAMLFAAFGHATEEQVSRSGFTSVHEVQSRYFHLLSDMYDDAQAEGSSSEMNDLVLAKTSLLLSLWCPPKLELSANSLWADRAMYHTKRYLRNSPPDEFAPMPKRRNILVWCCVARNTFLSYAMHRPYRFCMEEAPLCNPDDLRTEFDRELQFHNYCSPAAKVRMVEDFVFFCKLSQNLLHIRCFQQSLPHHSIAYINHNNAEQVEDPEELRQCLSQYLNASRAETELVNLIELHEYVKCQQSGLTGSERATELIAARTRSYTLQIITFSSIASLFQHTILMNSSTWARSCYNTALEKVFDASKKVACIVEHMLTDVPIEAVPGTLLAWTTSPMIPLLVEQNCSKFGLPSLHFNNEEDSSDSALSTSHARDIASLLDLTSRLAKRFHSAGDAWALLRDADHVLCTSAASVASSGQQDSLFPSEAQIANSSRTENIESLRLLAQAVGFVKAELSGSGSGRIPVL